MAFEKETAYFNAHKVDLMQHYKGQFALIKEEDLLGTYTTFEEAFEAGVKLLGNQAFLIRQVVEGEEVVQYPALAAGMLNAHS